MATGTGFLKGRGEGGGPSGVPQADGTVVRPKDTDTVFLLQKFETSSLWLLIIYILEV